MNLRLLVCVISSLASVGMISGVYVQNRQLAQLKTEQQRMLSHLSGPEAAPAPQRPAVENAAPGDAPPELLQLRSEVNRLTRRKRELQGVENENQRLRNQVTERSTNSTPYIRKSSARQAGYQTPEGTLETFLWALQNRNFRGLIDTLTPETAAQFQQQNQGGNFLEGSEALFGLGIQKKESMPDGSVRLAIQIAPDVPSAWFTFRRVGNDWKLDWPPKE